MRKDFLIFLSLLPIIFYPMSPVFQNIVTGAEVFVLLTIVSLAIILSTISLEKSKLEDEWFIWITIVFLLVHFLVAYRNLTDLRLIVACMLSIGIMRLPSINIRNIIWYFALFFTFIFFLGVMVQLLLYSGALTLEDWHVDRLNFISEGNSAATRGDFNYYLPLYLMNITYAKYEFVSFFGLTFQRFPFIFIEPTHAALYVSPILFSVLLFKEKATLIRVPVCVALILLLLWSFSTAGLLVTFLLIPASIMIEKALVLFFSTGKKISNIALLFIMSFAIVIVYLSVIYVEAWIGVVGGNKLQQLQYYTEGIQVINNISYLGSARTEVKEISFGVLNIFMRWGIIGIALTLLIWSTNILKLLVKYRQIVFVSPLLVITILLLKLPLLFNIYYVLIFAFVLSEHPVNKKHMVGKE